MKQNKDRWHISTSSYWLKQWTQNGQRLQWSHHVPTRGCWHFRCFTALLLLSKKRKEKKTNLLDTRWSITWITYKGPKIYLGWSSYKAFGKSRKDLEPSPKLWKSKAMNCIIQFQKPKLLDLETGFKKQNKNKNLTLFLLNNARIKSRVMTDSLVCCSEILQWWLTWLLLWRDFMQLHKAWMS